MLINLHYIYVCVLCNFIASIMHVPSPFTSHSRKTMNTVYDFGTDCEKALLALSALRPF